MSKDRLVFSTEQGSQRKQKSDKTYAPTQGPTKMRLETKGRGGKAVTVLWNFPFPEETIRAMMKDVQARKACGASFKEARVEFQGDIREAVSAYFQEQAWKIVAAGG